MRIKIHRGKKEEQKEQKNLTEPKLPTWDVVCRYSAQHSTARRSKPLAEPSPPPRASHLRTLRPASLRSAARLDGTAPAVGPSSHHARSLGRLVRPILRPHPSAAGMAASGGDALELVGKPPHLARPPARRVAGRPALYALCAIDRTPQFVRGWICLLACC